MIKVLSCVYACVRVFVYDAEVAYVSVLLWIDHDQNQGKKIPDLIPFRSWKEKERVRENFQINIDSIMEL